MITHYTQTLSHVAWECKYHIVITPKYRKRIIYGKVKDKLRIILHQLAKQRESKIIQGALKDNHVHMVISIPPKHSISMVIGFIKGKSAIRIHQEVLGYKRAKNYYGKHFWSRGYFVSTIGLDEVQIRKYVRSQEESDRRIDGYQMDMGWY